MNLLNVTTANGYYERKKILSFFLYAFAISGIVFSFFCTYAIASNLLAFFAAPAVLAVFVAALWEFLKAITAHHLAVDFFKYKLLDTITLVLFCAFWGSSIGLTVGGAHIRGAAHTEQILNDSTYAPAPIPTIAPPDDKVSTKGMTATQAYKTQKRQTAAMEAAATIASATAAVTLKQMQQDSTKTALKLQSIQQKTTDNIVVFLFADVIILLCTLGGSYISCRKGEQEEEEEDESDPSIITDQQLYSRFVTARSKGALHLVSLYGDEMKKRGIAIPTKKTPPHQRQTT